MNYWTRGEVRVAAIAIEDTGTLFIALLSLPPIDFQLECCSRTYLTIWTCHLGQDAHDRPYQMEESHGLAGWRERDWGCCCMNVTILCY